MKQANGLGGFGFRVRFVLCYGLGSVAAGVESDTREMATREPEQRPARS
jgi:hypothetical protein